jgi:hypothetical protein
MYEWCTVTYLSSFFLGTIESIPKRRRVRYISYFAKSKVSLWCSLGPSAKSPDYMATWHAKVLKCVRMLSLE